MDTKSILTPFSSSEIPLAVFFFSCSAYRIKLVEIWNGRSSFSQPPFNRVGNQTLGMVMPKTVHGNNHRTISNALGYIPIFISSSVWLNRSNLVQVDNIQAHNIGHTPPIIFKESRYHFFGVWLISHVLRVLGTHVFLFWICFFYWIFQYHKMFFIVQ